MISWDAGIVRPRLFKFLAELLDYTDKFVKLRTKAAELRMLGKLLGKMDQLGIARLDTSPRARGHLRIFRALPQHGAAAVRLRYVHSFRAKAASAHFNNRFANLRYATRSQKSRQPAPPSKARAATAPAMAPASRSGSAPTPTPARTRCRRAEGATKRRHWAECFGGGMTGRSCGVSQHHPTLTSHERAAAHSITPSARASTVGT